eukprot:430128-Lingulodinium_polyedra.AAC.1
MKSSRTALCARGPSTGRRSSTPGPTAGAPCVPRATRPCVGLRSSYDARCAGWASTGSVL